MPACDSRDRKQRTMMRAGVLWLAMACLPAWATGTAPAAPQAVSFGLFGDVPYNAWEREHLPELLADMAKHPLAFVVHDGDIKSGSSECSDAVMHDMLALFNSSEHPLVYVPGDNEWTDCHRKNNGRFDPLERLAKLRDVFFKGDKALGKRALALERQSADPAFAEFREHVRWRVGGVLFVGLNVTGSDNNFHGEKKYADTGANKGAGPVPEFVRRSAATRAWMSQAFALAQAQNLRGLVLLMQGNPDFSAEQEERSNPGFSAFLSELRGLTSGFAGQVVLVHGDTHRYRVDQPLHHAAGGPRIANFTRVETMGSPFFGWVKVTVDPADPRLFRFEPLMWKSGTP